MTAPPPSSADALLRSPQVAGDWPIGQAAQFLRLTPTAGLRVEVGLGAWGWVPREDVLTAARLGAMRAPLRRLVGAVQREPAGPRPLLLTRQVTPDEAAETSLGCLAAARRAG